MSSAAQLSADRTSAQKSTRPVTSERKAAVPLLANDRELNAKRAA
jgi:hypothetical protein